MNRFRWVIAAMFSVLLGACSSLPPAGDRITSTALADTGHTRLGLALAPAVAQHPGKTGVHALADPRDAFVARAVLAAMADRSIDAQYYIWRGDAAGTILFEALWEAAQRGVRVRLLLDDHNTGGLDPTIAALDAHPNIQVRLYNPLGQRAVRAINYLTDFSRVNRRMHNKSFTVDNQMSVVGGRNIGDEYFGAGSGMVFADLDVTLVGAAVQQASLEFDTYWNSASAYPAADLLRPGAAADDQALQARFLANRSSQETKAYLEAVRASPLARRMLDRTVAFEWTTARILWDDPAKTLDAEARRDDLMFPRLIESLGRPEKRLDIVSPYFVPGEQGTASLSAIARRGVEVRILTNSLASSDASVVHAGYAKRRADLLRGGVRIYELKPTAVEVLDNDRRVGSSASTGLHAKTFAVDGERIFVGSFNLDPRSLLLNTEMGVVLDSPRLAQMMAESFDTTVSGVAYEVRLGEDGHHLVWIEQTAEGQRTHATEPGTTWLQRSGVSFLAILPIEWLL
jgi:putative cardiolipin synthase